MANLICDMTDCKHRSKRPLRKWRNKNGSRCYGGTLQYILIDLAFDPDGDIEATVGRDNMAHCARYEPKISEMESYEQGGE